jgi:hypothetical protein
VADSITIKEEFTIAMEYAGKEYALDIKKCLQHDDHDVYFFVTSNGFRPNEHYEITKSEVLSAKWAWYAKAHGTDVFISQIGEAIDSHYCGVK